MCEGRVLQSLTDKESFEPGLGIDCGEDIDEALA